MPYYSDDVRLDILTVYLSNNKNARSSVREYRRLYPNRPVPSRKTFQRMLVKMSDTKTLKNKKKIRNNDENRELNILLYFDEDRKKSLRDCSRDLDISYSMAQRTLHKYKYKARKPSVLQKLYPNDNIVRNNFCQIMLEKHREDPLIFNHIFWTDEASFSTSGINNRKNNHYWAPVNLHIVEEIQFQGRRTLNLWAGIFNNRVIYKFFEGNMNGVKYLDILREIIENNVDNLPLNQMIRTIWQHDGARYHNNVNVTTLLNQNFNEWIGRHGPITWPPRSPDLTPLDFFFGAI